LIFEVVTRPSEEKVNRLVEITKKEEWKSKSVASPKIFNEGLKKKIGKDLGKTRREIRGGGRSPVRNSTLIRGNKRRGVAEKR